SLQSQFRHDVLVGDAAVLAAGLGRPANVGLILQRLQRSVEELRRDDNSPATAASAENLHRRPLCGVEYLALIGAEVAGRRGHHDVNGPSCTTRGLVGTRPGTTFSRQIRPGQVRSSPAQDLTSPAPVAAHCAWPRVSTSAVSSGGYQPRQRLMTRARTARPGLRSRYGSCRFASEPFAGAALCGPDGER